MSKNYSLFLDDERFPADYSNMDWTIARSFDEAVFTMEKEGSLPVHISFDHDLGEGKNGLDVANWMIEQHLDGKLIFPENFSFYVHSMNPISAENIRKLMNSFIKVIRDEP